MKKIAIIALVAMVLATPIFAQAAAEKDEKVHLTFVEVMTSPERTLVLQEAIKNFEAANPNVEVELVSPPYEQAETKLASMLAAGQDVE